MPVGVGSKVNDIWLLVSKAPLDIIPGHMCSTTSSTNFPKQRFRHVLEWDAHPSGNGGGNTPQPRPIYQRIATALYILGFSGAGAERARISLDIGYGTV